MLKQIAFSIFLFLFLTEVNAQIEFKYKDKPYRAIIIKDSADMLTMLNKSLDTYSIKRSEISEIRKIKCAITRLSKETTYKFFNYGKVDSVVNDTVFFKDDDGTNIKFRRWFLEEINFIDEETVKAYSVGLVAGYPSELSLMFSYKTHFNISFGASALIGITIIDGYTLPCFRGNVFYCIVNKPAIESNAGLFLSAPIDILNSKSLSVDRDIRNNGYWGPYADINFHNIYLSLGLGMNGVDATAFVSIGYVYRFNL